MNELVIKILNEAANGTGLTLADLPIDHNQEKEVVMEINESATHTLVDGPQGGMTPEEAMIPELCDQDDYDSDSESGDSVDGGEAELEELDELLNADSDSTGALNEDHVQPVRSSTRSTSRVTWRDEAYDWTLMNRSVHTALKNFGAVASDTCRMS
jgi:hypothetical protein